MSQIDLILPVLDEADAIPWVLDRLPDDIRPIVVDNGSGDGSPELAAGLGATVVIEPRRGFGAACFAGLLAARAPVVAFMDCDGSLDPGDLGRVTGPVLAGDADLMLGARDADRGAWPLHARVANRALSWELRRRSGIATSDLGPMRAAPRGALLDLGIRDRRFGWPLEMVLRAAERGWRIDEVAVPYRARAGRSKVTGTVRGTARDRARHGGGAAVSSRTLLVIAKAPVAGQVKTRLTPPCSPRQAAALAAAALGDTLAAVAASRADRRVLVLDGSMSVPAGFDVVVQRGAGLGLRLTAAFADTGGTGFVVAMDTPQLTPELLGAALDALERPGVDVAIGATPDGGYWGIGFARPVPGAFTGVPMSTPRTYAAQRARLAELGLAVAELPALRDVDGIGDARVVAAQAPRTRFAATLVASGHARDGHQAVPEAAA